MPVQKQPVTFAAYLRYSHEEQRGNMSLDVQLRVIQQFVQNRGGVIVKIYTDEAQSARTTKRDEFKQMQIDAKEGLFQAVVVAYWSRLNRNRTDARAVKTQFRRDYGIPVFSATEMSEHDGSMGGFIEGIMEVQAEYYSNELSEKYRNAYRELFLQGYYTSSTRVFGYNIKKEIDPLTGKQIGRNELVINEHERQGVLLAYEQYSTGKFSYNDIAHLLNEAGYRTIKGRRFSHDGMKELLCNPIYIGKLRHQESRYDARGKRLYDNPIEESNGRHEPIVPLELWNKVQEVKARRTVVKRGANKHGGYMLQGLCYCWDCYSRSDEVEGKAPFWAKMHCRTNLGRGNRHEYKRYKCMARNRGYQCKQAEVAVEGVDEQVLFILRNLRVPADWRAKLVKAVALEMRDESIEKRLEEIKAVIERMDYRFDFGLVTDKTEFLTKRMELQQELEKLQPAADTNLLEVAADLIDNFSSHFDACGGDIDAQNQLIRRILERVFIQGKRVVALMFKADCHAVLHYGSDVARFYVGGKVELIDHLADEQVITQEGLEAETQAALEADRLYQELKAAYPEATDDEIQAMLSDGHFLRPEGFEPPTAGSEDRCSIH